MVIFHPFYQLFSLIVFYFSHCRPLKKKTSQERETAQCWSVIAVGSVMHTTDPSSRTFSYTWEQLRVSVHGGSYGVSYGVGQGVGHEVSQVTGHGLGYAIRLGVSHGSG